MLHCAPPSANITVSRPCTCPVSRGSQEPVDRDVNPVHICPVVTPQGFRKRQVGLVGVLGHRGRPPAGEEHPERSPTVQGWASWSNAVRYQDLVGDRTLRERSGLPGSRLARTAHPSGRPGRRSPAPSMQKLVGGDVALPAPSRRRTVPVFCQTMSMSQLAPASPGPHRPGCRTPSPGADPDGGGLLRERVSEARGLHPHRSTTEDGDLPADPTRRSWRTAGSSRATRWVLG